MIYQLYFFLEERYKAHTHHDGRRNGTSHVSCGGYYTANLRERSQSSRRNTAYTSPHPASPQAKGFPQAKGSAAGTHPGPAPATHPSPATATRPGSAPATTPAPRQPPTPAPRQPPPQRERPTAAKERPSSTDQDGAMECLIGLFLAGNITPETYVNGIKALTETPPTLAPIPPPRRRRASCRRRAQQAEETPSEQPILPPPPPLPPPPAGEGLSQFHPALASSPAGEGFSQFHPARASSPAGEGLSRARSSWRFTGFAGPLGHTCADGR